MICLITAALFLTGHAQDIPEGVHYKKASPELNAKFSKLLTDLFADKVPNDKKLGCLNDVMICGPGLWPLVEKVEGQDVGGKPSKFMIPINGQKEPQVLQGRTFQTTKDRLNFLDTIQSLAALGPMKIRRVTKAEIQYYWAIIPYDIEEPLLAAENKKITLLINGNKDKIFFVDKPGHTKP